MKNQKGITLIALVVTIIVLLILAGISIAMLTGENGIITNAQKSATYNAYAGAEEQFKLAYMAVRTEIMAQTVADGTYNPEKDLAHLASVAYTDLYDATNPTKWTVAYTGEEEKTIYIKYTDTAIDEAVISSSPKKPAQEGQVVYKIVVAAQEGTKKQTCTPDYDLGDAVLAEGAALTTITGTTGAAQNVATSPAAVAPYTTTTTTPEP